MQALPDTKTYIIIALLDNDLSEEYEAVDEKIEGNQEVLRNAFSLTSTMMDDMNKVFGFEKEGYSSEISFKKIEKLLKNIMRHKFNEEKLQHILYFTTQKIKN